MFLELLSPEDPKPWDDVVQKLKSPSFNMESFPPKKAQSFFEFCQFAVQHKAPTANFYLGLCYEEGTGTKKDIIQAISCFEQDAQEGGSLSQSALGKFYYGGKDVPQDLEKSMFWFEKGALLGDPTCMMMYVCSEMKKDPKQHLSPKSIGFVKKAADLHFAQAQHMCGLLYKDGASVPKDTKKAVDYFEASVENNFSESALELGILYRSGKDVPKDVKKSMFWFEKGALLGDPKCMVAYACAEYEKDPQNTSSSPLSIKSIGFLQKAAEQGNAQAQSILGACYLEGGGVTRNENEGAKWLTKAAEQGLSGAQLPLGVCYFNGVGVSKDAKEAVRWFTKAAEQGSPEAELILAKCYSQGTGTDANQIEANKWFAKAAEHGNPLAQCTLGARYSSGNGVTKDNKEAARLFAKAAEQGMPEAQFYLAGCYFSGLGVARNEEEAIKLLVKAAKSNYPLAQYNLGSCYYKGTGIAKDLKKAVYYLEAAQKNGCQEDNNLLKAAQTELEKDK
jgi:TPR repeat protein